MVKVIYMLCRMQMLAEPRAAQEEEEEREG